jgi:hypothetical protein
MNHKNTVQLLPNFKLSGYFDKVSFLYLIYTCQIQLPFFSLVFVKQIRMVKATLYSLFGLAKLLRMCS